MITCIPYIVLVVGAGRGPLVTCTMNAYHKVLSKINGGNGDGNSNRHTTTKGLQLQLYLYAVEKNPNAILYLRSKFQPWLQNSIVVPSTTTTSTSMFTTTTTPTATTTTPSIQLQIIQSDLRYLDANVLFQNIVQQHPQAQQSTPPIDTATSYKANLIVSELLGSFGCNELSPECLDTLLYHTNVCSNTITKSIPYHYTSHIAPISSMTLYHKVKQQALYPTCLHSTQQQMVGLVPAFETPYVVRPQMVSQIYATQDCWSFTHEPWNRAVVASHHIDLRRELERHVHLEFSATHGTEGPYLYGAQYGTGYGPCDEYIQSMMQALIENTTTTSSSNTKNSTSMDGESPQEQQSPSSSSTSSWTCTGVLGTFTADLYASSNNNGSDTTIQISTNPQTFSTGMFSWFPLYFPSLQPIPVPAHGVVHVDVWRKCSPTKVWYEWMFTVLVEPPRTNINYPSTSTVIPPDTTNTTTNMDMEQDVAVGEDSPVPQHSPVLQYVSPIHNPGGRSSYVSLLS